MVKPCFEVNKDYIENLFNAAGWAKNDGDDKNEKRRKAFSKAISKSQGTNFLYSALVKYTTYRSLGRGWGIDQFVTEVTNSELGGRPDVKETEIKAKAERKMRSFESSKAFKNAAMQVVSDMITKFKNDLTYRTFIAQHAIGALRVAIINVQEGKQFGYDATYKYMESFDNNVDPQAVAPEPTNVDNKFKSAFNYENPQSFENENDQTVYIARPEGKGPANQFYRGPKMGGYTLIAPDGTQHIIEPGAYGIQPPANTTTLAPANSTATVNSTANQNSLRTPLTRHFGKPNQNRRTAQPPQPTNTVTINPDDLNTLVNNNMDQDLQNTMRGAFNRPQRTLDYNELI